jgi:excisionase family DNA binding protein
MTDTPLTISIAEACKATGIGRTSIYSAIKQGELRAVKFAGRTLIRTEDLKAFVDNLPAMNAGTALNGKAS